MNKMTTMNKEIILTTLENDVILNGFGCNNFCDNGDPVWAWSVVDACKIVSKEQISGVISSLTKKGLTISDMDEDEPTIRLTSEGIKYLNQ